jgi:signal peptidase II
VKHETERDRVADKLQSFKRLVATFSVAALVLDLATKAWARKSLPSPDGFQLSPSLALRPRYNDGTMFGLLSGSTTLNFTILGTATLLVIVVLVRWAVYAKRRWITLGASLMATGALGNLIDRLIVGMVTDFVDVHVGSWGLPIFNLADIWMVVGLFLVLLDSRNTEGE